MTNKVYSDPVSVLGIDTGSYHTPSYVVWLQGDQIWYDQYRPGPGSWLPLPPSGVSTPVCIAIDAPQGLPLLTADPPIRPCDRDAATPTKRLPRTRDQLSSWRLYRPLIEVGIDLFWWCHTSPQHTVFGCGPRTSTVVCESYPRYILKRLSANSRIPSKRREPISYSEFVIDTIRARGLESGPVVRPTVDQCDALLCAVAARALCESGNDLPAGTVGTPPVVDEEARVLRDGFIVSP
jgi:hypothetical protein